jgi:hypothetical protein
MRRHFAALAFVFGLLASSVSLADSSTPPQGPPWKRDFAAAQAEALEKGLPIFVYLTKTH